MAKSIVFAPFVRNPYNYDLAAASEESGLRCDDPSLADQAGKEDADINVILGRFGVNGQVPVGSIRLPTSGDFTGINDFHTAITQVTRAQQDFNQLDAKLRYRFANDPQRLLEFLADPANKDEAVKLGLVDAPEVVVEAPPMKVEVVNAKPDKA